MNFLDILKAFLIGVIQGITEWLPISSTGHMILFEQFCGMNVSEQFMEMFRVVIQFGSILAVVILYWKRLFPFCPSAGKAERKSIWKLWLKIVIAVIPAGVVGVLFDDILDKYLYNYITVAAALIIYGVAFIVIERMHKTKKYPITSVDDIDAKTALKIGAFQTLSLIPGTSRSGSTIIGAMCVGVSRTPAAEFSFFLGLPIMLGASALKLVKFGFHFTGLQIFYLILGMVVAFGVSVYSIRFLMSYIKNNDFKFFGYYRIVLGVIVLAFFIVRALLS